VCIVVSVLRCPRLRYSVCGLVVLYCLLGIFVFLGSLSIRSMRLSTMRLIENAGMYMRGLLGDWVYVRAAECEEDE